MERYTKKDQNGRYYIESVNGKLESDIKGHTYGEAIDRFAELENVDVVPRSEVEHWKEEANRWQTLWCKTYNDFEISEMIAEAKQDVAREMLKDMREMIKGYENIDIYLDRIEKKYIGG